MAAPARAAAYQVLRLVSSGRADLGDALGRARDPLPDPRDRTLATDLAINTLRWRGAIDYQLERRSAKPLAKLDPGVLDALRLAAYQILYLERVPASAVVNDAVDLVKRGGFRSAAGFVNAVLRRLAREPELTWPSRENLVEHLSVVHSHPQWLVSRWLARCGVDATEAWLRFNNEAPPLTLVANRLRGSRDELAERLAREAIATTPTPIAPHGVRVLSGRPLAAAAFREGYCLVQDEASQIVPELLQAAPGHRVLDACASPGGKTMAAAAQAGPTSLVVACDVRARRVRLLQATIDRCQAANVRVVHIGDSTPLPFREETFDRVLIDAPCSGLGTVRRDPDIRWRRDPTQFAAFARTQLDLLNRAAPVVVSGGAIVYSTCSGEPEENEEVVAAFLRQHDDFSVQPIDTLGIAPAIVAMQTAQGHLRTTAAFGLEAFFGAVLRKQ